MHYVCLGQGELSDAPGVCKTEGCPRFGKPLAECDCTDGQHKSAIPPEDEKDETGEHPFEGR